MEDSVRSWRPVLRHQLHVLASQASAEEVRWFLDEVSRALYRNCPSGVGSSGELRLDDCGMDDVLQDGAKWALHHGSRAFLERQPRKSMSVGPGR